MSPMLLFPNAQTVWLIGRESLGSSDWQFWGERAFFAKKHACACTRTDASEVLSSCVRGYGSIRFSVGGAGNGGWGCESTA